MASSSADSPEVIELDDLASIGAFGEKGESVIEYPRVSSSSTRRGSGAATSGPGLRRSQPDLIDVHQTPPPPPERDNQQGGGFTDLLTRNWQSATGWVWQSPTVNTTETGGRLIDGGGAERSIMDMEPPSSVGEQSSSHHGLDIGATSHSLGPPVVVDRKRRVSTASSRQEAGRVLRDDFLASVEVVPPTLIDVGEAAPAKEVAENREGIMGGIMDWWAREEKDKPTSDDHDNDSQSKLNAEKVAAEEEDVDPPETHNTASEVPLNRFVPRPVIGKSALGILEGYSDSEVYSLSSTSSSDPVELPKFMGRGTRPSVVEETIGQTGGHSIDLLGLQDAPLPRGWLADVHSGFRIDALAHAMNSSNLPRATVAEMSREILAHAYGLPPRVPMPTMTYSEHRKVPSAIRPSTPLEPATRTVQEADRVQKRGSRSPLPSSTTFVSIRGAPRTYISANSSQEGADLAAARRVHSLVHHKDRPKPSWNSGVPTRLETIIDECKTLFKHNRERPVTLVEEPANMSEVGNGALEDSPEAKVETKDPPTILSAPPMRRVYCEVDQKTVAELRSPLGQFHSDLLQEALRAKAVCEKAERAYPVDSRVLADLARAARRRFHLSRTMASILEKSEIARRNEATGKTTIDPKPVVERHAPVYRLPSVSTPSQLIIEGVQPPEPRLLRIEGTLRRQSLDHLPKPDYQEHARKESSPCRTPSVQSSSVLGDSISSRRGMDGAKCSKCDSQIDMTGRRLSRSVKEQMSRWKWCEGCTFEMFPSISAAPKRSSFVSQRVYLGTNAEEWLWELTLESNLPIEYPEGSRVLWPTGRHLVVALLLKDADAKRTVRKAPTVEDVDAIFRYRKGDLREDYMGLREGAVQLVVDLRLKQHALLKVVLKSIPIFVVELKTRDNDELLGGRVAEVLNEARKSITGGGMTATSQ